jgi:hypothetical protein
MKVLFITQYFPPEIGAGPVRVESVTRRMADEGWEVDVICQVPNYPLGGSFGLYDGLWKKQEKKGSLKITRVGVWATPRKNRLQQLLLFGSFSISAFYAAVRNYRRPLLQQVFYRV